MIGAVSRGNLGLSTLAMFARGGARAVLILAFIVAGGGFSLQLSGLDPRAPVDPNSASAQSQIAIGAAFLILFAFSAAGWRRMAFVLRRNAVLLALPAWAVMSCVWAPEPDVALRRAAAFAATMLSGVALGSALSGPAAIRFLTQAIAAGIVLSIGYVILEPAFAIHQLTDGVQNVHAGDWRGLFLHRTTLGQIAALGLAFSIYSGGGAFGHLALRGGAILASILCLMMAHSAGAWVSAAILMATPCVLKIGQASVRRRWLFAAALATGALVLTLLLTPVLAALVLQGLGKDVTLTGRTALWRLMTQAAAAHPWLGYGYSTGFRDAVARFVSTHSAFGYVPNAQNGYLDTVLNLGLVGLGLALMALGLAVYRAIRLALGREPADGLAILPLLIVVFIAEINLVEAELVSANDIFVLIYATAFAASGDRLLCHLPGAGLRSMTQATAVKAR